MTAADLDLVRSIYALSRDLTQAMGSLKSTQELCTKLRDEVVALKAEVARLKALLREGEASA